MAPSPTSRSPIVWLLGAVIALLLALLLVLLFQRPEGDGPGQSSKFRTIKAGESMSRDELSNAPKAPKKIDPDRIAAVARVGRTYESLLKGSMDARASNREWGVTTTMFMQHLFECALDRTIEKNDGDTIVEVRHYKTIRSSVVTAEVEEVKFEFGTPGSFALDCLNFVQPGSSVVFETIQPLAVYFAKNAYQSQLDEYATVRGAVDSLSGKKVRITFTNGVGVARVEPIGFELNPDEYQFVFATAVLADYFIMPDQKIAPGANWSVDSDNFTGFLDPSLRGKASGAVTITRVENTTAGGHQAAVLEMNDGRIVIDSTTPKQYEIGKFIPRGRLIFDLEDEFVASGELAGDIDIRTVSRDHILFETRYETRPVIKVNYTCRLR